jgi:hypothetical protein
MGSLIQKIGHTDVNATIELLDQYGVTVDGLKTLRAKTPPAVIRQLVRFIETGIVSDEVALSAFTTFTAMIGRPNLTEVENKWSDGENRHIDDLPVRGLEKLLPQLPPREEKFILMRFGDFTRFPNNAPTLGQLTDQKWLRQWSEKNLVGFTLELCRKDTAPYLADIRGNLWRGGELWIATGSLKNADPKTMLILEDFFNRTLRLKLIKYRGIETPCLSHHIVFQVGKR